MAEKFNPLKAWLGVDIAKPSYYQLFGLPNFESEPPVIADAADRAIRKAQKHVAGEHRAAAEKLVRDLTTVKNVLLSAEKRQAYDLQLRKQIGGAPSGRPASHQPPAPAPVSMLPQAVEATDSPTMMLPPGALSAALSSLPMPGMPQPSMPPGTMPYGGAAPYGVAPNYADPMQGMYGQQPGLPNPVGAYGQGYGAPAGFPPAGPEPAAVFNYGPPPTSAGIPDAFGGMQPPGMSPLGMPQPVMATAAPAPAMGMSPQAQAGGGFAPQVSTGRIRAAASRKQQQSNITMAIGVLGVAAVILVVVIVIANKKSADQAAEQSNLALLTKSPPPQPKSIAPLPSANMPLNTPPANNTPAVATSGSSGPSEMERLQRMQIPTMTGPSSDSMPSNSDTPTAMPSPTSTAPAAPALTIRGVTTEAPLMEASLPEDAARAKSVPAMLSAARASFRTRDYAKAEEVILSAQITADTPALIELARGHARALDLVRTFWDAARLGLKSVKPGDELLFAGKSASVVSADETNLVVKLENRDVPLVVDKLIPLVAAQLAEKALPKDDPGSKLVVAVFLLLDQPAGVERGKQLFDEATVAGLDVNSLRPLLNSK